MLPVHVINFVGAINRQRIRYAAILPPQWEDWNLRFLPGIRRYSYDASRRMRCHVAFPFFSPSPSPLPRVLLSSNYRVPLSLSLSLSLAETQRTSPDSRAGRMLSAKDANRSPRNDAVGIRYTNAECPSSPFEVNRCDRHNDMIITINHAVGDFLSSRHLAYTSPAIRISLPASALLN
jgi:hypothetical protein